MSTTVQEFKTVDVLKFIFAIFVVCLHVPLTNPAIEAWFEPLFFRLAVPYFFVASGFFLGLKLYDVRGGGKMEWRVWPLDTKIINI